MSSRDHELLQTTKPTPQPSLTIHSSVYRLGNTGSFLIQTLTNPVLKHNRFCTNAGVPGKAAVVTMHYTKFTVLQTCLWPGSNKIKIIFGQHNPYFEGERPSQKLDRI